jgi:hypothetical protein
MDLLKESLEKEEESLTIFEQLKRNSKKQKELTIFEQLKRSKHGV